MACVTCKHMEVVCGLMVVCKGDPGKKTSCHHCHHCHPASWLLYDGKNTYSEDYLFILLNYHRVEEPVPNKRTSKITQEKIKIMTIRKLPAWGVRRVFFASYVWWTRVDWRLRIPSARIESQMKSQPYTFWRPWIFSCCQAGRAQFTLSQMLWKCQHYAKLWLFGSGSAKHHWLNSGQTDVHVTAWEVCL